MRERRTLERLTGRGAVTHDNGDRVRVMTYNITTMQDFIDGIPGLKGIHGRVRIEGTEGFDLLGKPLTLHLEDGRVLDFFISDSDGNIANRSQRFTVSTAA